MNLKQRAVLLLSGLTLSGSLYASGLPVIDAASIQQAILTLNQLKEEYQQLQREYESITGSRGYADILANGLGIDISFKNLEELANFDFAGQLEDVMRDGVTKLSSDGRAVFNRYDLGALCDGYKATHQQHCLIEQATKAERFAMYETNITNIKQAQENIKDIRAAINTTDDPKAIAELQARIGVEQAFLESAVTSLEVVQRQQQLQEAILNEKKDALTRSMFKVENNSNYSSVTDGSIFR